MNESNIQIFLSSETGLSAQRSEHISYRSDLNSAFVVAIDVIGPTGVSTRFRGTACVQDHFSSAFQIFQTFVCCCQPYASKRVRVTNPGRRFVTRVRSPDEGAEDVILRRQELGRLFKNNNHKNALNTYTAYNSVPMRCERVSYTERAARRVISVSALRRIFECNNPRDDDEFNLYAFNWFFFF
jgi:hypothetical protein